MVLVYDGNGLLECLFHVIDCPIQIQGAHEGKGEISICVIHPYNVGKTITGRGHT